VKQLIKTIFKIFTPLRVGVILGIAAFFWFLLFGDQGIVEMNKLSMMKKKLIYQKEQLKTDIEKLTREKAALSDSKNLEPVIRNELGYIRPGEVIYQEKEEK